MKVTVITGVLVEREQPLNFAQLCQAVGLERSIIIEMIEQHLIEPTGHSPDEWCFDTAALRRAKIAANFYRDLEINVAGIALALDLLDKIEHLEQRLSLLEKFTQQ